MRELPPAHTHVTGQAGHFSQSVNRHQHQAHHQHPHPPPLPYRQGLLNLCCHHVPRQVTPDPSCSSSSPATHPPTSPHRAAAATCPSRLPPLHPSTLSRVGEPGNWRRSCASEQQERRKHITTCWVQAPFERPLLLARNFPTAERPAPQFRCLPPNLIERPLPLHLFLIQ